jgi:hypothetical protein
LPDGRNGLNRGEGPVGGADSSLGAIVRVVVAQPGEDGVAGAVDCDPGRAAFCPAAERL